MGSPPEATLLRRDLVAVHRKHGAKIGALLDDNSHLVSELSGVTAERDGLRITCRLQEAALATAAGANAGMGERCKRAEEDREKLHGLLRRHENPNSQTSSRAVATGSATGCAQRSDRTTRETAAGGAMRRNGAGKGRGGPRRVAWRRRWWRIRGRRTGKRSRRGKARPRRPTAAGGAARAGPTTRRRSVP